MNRLRSSLVGVGRRLLLVSFLAFGPTACGGAAGGCVSDADCSGHQACQAGVCVQPCVFTSDCQSGEACIDGACTAGDACPDDPNKVTPGVCGCGVPDVDSDFDGTLDCEDACPHHAIKTAPGTCGCAEPDIDINGDGVPDCVADGPLVGVLPVSLSVNEGGTADIVVTLLTPPNGDVAVRAESPEPTAVLLHHGTNTPAATATLVFTPSDYAPKTLTVTGVEDTLVEAPQLVTVTFEIDPLLTTDTSGYADIQAADVNDVEVTVNDTTVDDPPVAGGGGTITVANVSTTSLTLSWAAAVDDLTPQEELKYRVVRSSTANLGTADEALAKGEAIGEPWHDNLTTLQVTNLTSNTQHHFNVIVRDAAENIAGYNAVSVTTLAVDAPEISVLYQGAEVLNGSQVRLPAASADGPGGWTGEAQAFTIRNLGSANLEIGTPISLSGAGASAFKVDQSSLSQQLAPQGETTFTIVADPSDFGDTEATLTISSNDSDESTFAIPLVVEGIDAAPIPGDGGVLTLTPGTFSVDISWTQADDDLTSAPSELEYLVVRSAPGGTLGVTVDFAINFGIEVTTGLPASDVHDEKSSDPNYPWIAGPGSITAMAPTVPALLPDTAYSFQVIVRDPSDNRTQYVAASVSTLPLTDAVFIYRSQAKHSGNLGGRSGADAICAADYTSRGLQLGCNAHHAVLSVEGNDDVLSMPTNYALPDDRPVVSEDHKTLLANNWGDLFVPLEGQYLRQTLHAASVLPSHNERFWTGTRSDPMGTLHPLTCSGWTASSGQGVHGFGDTVDSSWITAPGAADCVQSLYVVCACW